MIDEQSLMMQKAPYSDGINHAPIIFTNEIFKPVPGFNNRYFISSLGRLYDSNYKWQCKPTIGKYVRYYLKYGINDSVLESAQKLMMITFKPEPDMENKQIVFLDQNPMNLVLDNMIWMSLSDKGKYLCEIGVRGGEKSRTIYTEDQIKRVCMLLEKGFNPEEIKKIMIDLPEDGSTPFHSICSRLKAGTSWKHVSKKYNLSTIDRHIDKDLIDKVCILLSQGKSTDQIAKELDLSYTEYLQIKNLCSHVRARRGGYAKYAEKYPNIPSVRKIDPLTDEEIDMIMQLRAQGYIKSHIIDILQKDYPNITRTKVYKLIKHIRENPNARGADVAIKYGINLNLI